MKVVPDGTFSINSFVSGVKPKRKPEMNADWRVYHHIRAAEIQHEKKERRIYQKWTLTLSLIATRLRTASGSAEKLLVANRQDRLGAIAKIKCIISTERKPLDQFVGGAARENCLLLQRANQRMLPRASQLLHQRALPLVLQVRIRSLTFWIQPHRLQPLL